jgi:hypothetical protein
MTTTPAPSEKPRQELPLSHYRFVPLERAIVPPGGLIQHIKDSWWCVHPEKGVAFYVGANGKHESPQCNTIQSITQRLAPSWAEVQFIPSVFLSIDPHDYV